MKFTFTLIHDNTSMKSGFSKQNSIEKLNQNFGTIIYQRSVKNNMSASSIKPSTIRVFIAVKGARRRYDEEQKETKKNEQETVKEIN